MGNSFSSVAKKLSVIALILDEANIPNDLQYIVLTYIGKGIVWIALYANNIKCNSYKKSLIAEDHLENKTHAAAHCIENKKDIIKRIEILECLIGCYGDIDTLELLFSIPYYNFYSKISYPPQIWSCAASHNRLDMCKYILASNKLRSKIIFDHGASTRSLDCALLEFTKNENLEAVEWCRQIGALDIWSAYLGLLQHYFYHYGTFEYSPYDKLDSRKYFISLNSTLEYIPLCAREKPIIKFCWDWIRKWGEENAQRYSIHMDK